MVNTRNALSDNIPLVGYDMFANAVGEIYFLQFSICGWSIQQPTEEQEYGMYAEQVLLV